MGSVWEILKFASRWLGPMLILIAVWLLVFPFAPFMDGLSVVVALAGAAVTAIACVFTRRPERRTSRKMLAVATLAGLAFAGWQFGETTSRYRQKTVSFDNRGAHLVGTLYLPERQGSAAGIVFIHGSGALPRSNYAGWATQFARWGYAVLVYDKRGTGDSTGHFEELEALRPDNIDLLASDASAAHDFLAARPDVRKDMVGFFGASQAGWIAPRAAVLNGRAAFMLLLSGPVTSTHAWLRYERLHLGPPKGAPTFAGVMRAASRGDIPDGMTADEAFEVAQRQPQAFSYGDYDPVTDLRALNIPGLWLLGDRDWMVPSRSTARHLQSLRDSGKPYDFRNIPGAGHAMMPGPARLVEDTVEQWLARVTRR